MRIVTRILLLCLAAVVMTAGSLQAKTLTRGLRHQLYAL